MSLIRINEAVIVEGKYDKIRLESLIDALIIPTDGFGIFKNKEKQKLLRTLAQERGLLILTDSDGAGFVIRNFLSGCVDPSRIKHAYIPQIAGKERRKAAPSKEGTLGVEGMDTGALLEALRHAGVETGEQSDERRKPSITRERLFDDGFIGREDSARLRALLLERLGLPSHLSTASLLRVLNMLCDEQRYERAAREAHSAFGSDG